MPARALELEKIGGFEQGRLEVFDSAESLCSHPSIDVVYVLTNLETHLMYATLAVQNRKHCFVEKPTAASTDEIHALMATVGGIEYI